MTERIELPAIEFVGIIARRLVRGMPMPVRALMRDCAPLIELCAEYSPPTPGNEARLITPIQYGLY